MISKVIAFVNSKGGVGKTTYATNLAVSLAKKNKSVCTLDLDSQGSMESFLIDYAGDLPSLQHKHIPVCALGSVPKLVRDLQPHNHYIILDVRGGDVNNIQNIMSFADWFIIPARPSKKDIMATSALLISLAQQGNFSANPALNAIVLMNQCSFHPLSTSADEAVEALNTVINQYGIKDRVKILNNRLHLATAWIEADMECKSIDEMGSKSKAAIQWSKIMAELSKKGVI